MTTERGVVVNWKEFLSSPQACVVALVLVFLVVRVFVPEPYYFVGVDEARYLGLAQNFPEHKLYSDTLFLQHMPLYPYLIAITDFVLNDLLSSGLFVAFLMSGLTLVVLLFLFKNLKKKNAWLFLFALLFSLNWALAELSRLVFKETTYIAFFWASIMFFWLGLKKSKKWFWASGVFAALTALASDQVIFLFPIFLLTAFLTRTNFRQWQVFVPLIMGGVAYAFWLVLRLSVYLSVVAAPIGVDGVIEDTTSFGIGQLLSPFSFPESVRLTEAEFTIDFVQMAGAVGYLFNTYPFLITPNLSRTAIDSLFGFGNLFFVLVWYVPVIAWLAWFLWKKAKKVFEKKNYFNNLDVLFAAYLAILLVPMLTGVGVWRHIILSLIPLLYFETQALFSIFQKFMEKDVVRKGFVVIACFFVVVWIATHPHLSFAREPIVQGRAVAEELKTLPEKGVFVQTGYSMELAYLLPEKRVYGLVSDINNMKKYLGMFNITYVVLGNKTWAPANEPSVKYVRARTDMFFPIKTIKEEYPLESVLPDKFVIYQVNQSLVPREV